MIKNVRALKEELKERLIINYVILVVLLLTLILFPKDIDYPNIKNWEKQIL